MDHSEKVLEEVVGEAHRSHRREEFWLKMASWTFGLWALMLPTSALIVLNKIDNATREQKEVNVACAAGRENLDRRLTLVEERQRVVIGRQDHFEKDLEELQK